MFPGFYRLLFCVSLLPFLLGSSYEKLDNIQKKLNQNKTKLTHKKKAKYKVKKSIGQLSKQLRLSELKLQQTRKKYRAAQKRHKQTSQTLAETQATFSNYQSLLSQRLSIINRHKPVGFLEMLFSPDAVDLSAPYVFKKILAMDVDLLRQTKESQLKLQALSQRFSVEKDTIASLKQRIQSNEKRLNKQKAAKQRYYQRLNAQIRKLEKQNKELLASSKEITRLLSRRSQHRKGYYGSGSFIKPVKGWLSSKYGPRKHPLFKRYIKHNGVDFAAPKGYKIRAANSGYVLVAGRQKRYKGYGNITIIDHGRRQKDQKRVSTVYAHQSRVLVKAGDFVRKGDVIGWVGATGYATGPHLHFELRLNGVPVNPLRYLKL
ncbi:MAG: peptidoglycan DD-metalloendopeptidase family protein [bacterium]